MPRTKASFRVKRFTPCKGIRNIFASGIQNPGIWNPANSSRNPESHSVTTGIGNPNFTDQESRIHVPGIRNPESTAWNPESETVLDSLKWGKTFIKESYVTSPVVSYTTVLCVLWFVEKRCVTTKRTSSNNQIRSFHPMGIRYQQWILGMVNTEKYFRCLFFS